MKYFGRIRVQCSTGPNTTTGHTSVLFAEEVQVRVYHVFYPFLTGKPSSLTMCDNLSNLSWMAHCPPSNRLLSLLADITAGYNTASTIPYGCNATHGTALVSRARCSVRSRVPWSCSGGSHVRLGGMIFLWMVRVRRCGYGAGWFEN